MLRGDRRSVWLELDETGPALLSRSCACESFVDLAGKERFARVDFSQLVVCKLCFRSSRRGGGVGRLRRFGAVCVCQRGRLLASRDERALPVGPATLVDVCGETGAVARRASFASPALAQEARLKSAVLSTYGAVWSKRTGERDCFNRDGKLQRFTLLG